MRLILTSNGISSKKVEREFLKILGGEIKDKKILVLRSSRRNPDEYGEEILAVVTQATGHDEKTP